MEAGLEGRGRSSMRAGVIGGDRVVPLPEEASAALALISAMVGAEARRWSRETLLIESFRMRPPPRPCRLGEDGWEIDILGIAVCPTMA